MLYTLLSSAFKSTWHSIQTAHAQGLASVEEGIATVAGDQLNSEIGGGEFGGIIQEMFDSIVPIMDAIALLVIIIFGMWMILAETEDQRTTARKVIATTAMGIVLLNLVQPIFDIYTNWDRGGVDLLITEVLGILRFLETPIAIVAVLVILVTGMRAVISFGGEEGLQNMRKAVISIVLGIILLSFKFAIAESFTETFTPGPVIQVIMTVVNTITFFTGTLAVGAIIYAGMIMIINVGNEDQYNKAKQIIVRVSIGIIVILLSVAIINAILEIDVFGLFE